MAEVILDANELSIARKCLEMAICKGAQKARVTATKSIMDLVGTLNGQVDKVTHCLDRSLSVCIFVDGKYGSYATNRLEADELDSFLDQAISMTRMLADDSCRDLPDPSRTEKNSRDGKEMDLYDAGYVNMSPERRLQLALGASIFGKAASDEWTLVSEEGEYSDSIYDTYLIDSQGLECRHTETSYEYGVESTIEDAKGNKFSGYWWDASPRLKDVDINSCCRTALDKAVGMMNPKRHKGGKFKLVIDSEASSKAISSILNALNAYSIQQGNSFMADTLGKKVFPEGLTVVDCCRIKGESGSKCFDSEGVATRELPIIDHGVVREYFVNTYMANKTGLEPTVEDATRPKIMPYPEAGLTRDDLLKMCGDGILVTDFNGGNSNSATGDFSYGIEGFAFRNGKITHPVREMVMTGNFIELWKGFMAAASDARPCRTRLTPTLAFTDVDFSA